MKVDREYIIELIKKMVDEKRFIKGIVSNPVGKKNIRTKVNIKPVIIKDELTIQLEEFKENKAYHENICAECFIMKLVVF